MTNLFVGQYAQFNIYTGFTDTVDSCEILFHRPDKSKGVWPGTFLNGVVSYDGQGADLNMAGEWLLHAHIISGGEDYYSPIVSQMVLNTLK